MTAREEARKALVALGARGETVASAESLTGGLVADAFVSVPGTSAVFRGGVVAYHTDLKSSLLGVPDDLLAERGAVDGDVAREMARGVRERFGADWGVSTTGVAGPDPQDGAEPGRVFVAVSGARGEEVRELDLPGDREHIRQAAAEQALLLLEAVVADHRVPTSGGPPEHPAVADR
jgi:nicotinamide-nucleotide amidase